MIIQKKERIQIALIRAGKTKSGLEGKYLGWKDEPLLTTETKRLEQQATEGHYPKFKKIYTSPLNRCRQTAQIIYKGIPAILENGFAPFDIGILEGITHNQRSSDIMISGNESPYKFIAKVKKAFLQMIYDCERSSVKKVSIVTHHHVIRTIVREFVQPTLNYTKIEVNYGDFIMLEHLPDIGLSYIVSKQ